MRHHRNLPPTRWCLVARAGNREGEAWTTALDQLVTAYRPALVRHLVANMRLPPDRAEDLVQAFLADRLLDRNVLRQAAREKGRFRSFLLKVFSNFAIGQLRRQQAQGSFRHSTKVARGLWQQPFIQRAHRHPQLG